MERLGEWGRHAGPKGGELEAQHTLHRYGRCTEIEADHIRALVDLAWDTMADFDAFVEATLLYFPAASYTEARQRLCTDVDCWEGFLGATDPAIAAWPVLASRTRADSRSIVSLIEPYNLAGLGRPDFGRRIPASIDCLIENASKLGLDRATLGTRLARLRGFDDEVRASPSAGSSVGL